MPAFPGHLGARGSGPPSLGQGAQSWRSSSCMQNASAARTARHTADTWGPRDLYAMRGLASASRSANRAQFPTYRGLRVAEEERGINCPAVLAPDVMALHHLCSHISLEFCHNYFVGSALVCSKGWVVPGAVRCALACILLHRPRFDHATTRKGHGEGESGGQSCYVRGHGRVNGGGLPTRSFGRRYTQTRPCSAPVVANCRVASSYDSSCQILPLS